MTVDSTPETPSITEADLRSASLVLTRLAADDGRRTYLNEVIAAFGFDRADLEAELDTDMSADGVGRDLTDEACRVLADRDRFEIGAEQAAEWERINRRPARELAGLRRLAERPSPFGE